MNKQLIIAAVTACAVAVPLSACTRYPEPSETERATVVTPSAGSTAPEYRSVYVPLPEGGSVLCVERTVKDGSSPAISCDWSRLRP